MNSLAVSEKSESDTGGLSLMLGGGCIPHFAFIIYWLVVTET